jgi:hypothetical protein
MTWTKWTCCGACAACLFLAAGVSAEPPTAGPAPPPAAPASPYMPTAPLRELPPAAPEATGGGPGKVLDRPLDTPPPAADFVPVSEAVGFRYPFYPPLGFTGPSSVLPTETQGLSDFVPIEDRWRLGSPPWDRYGQGHPPVVDYPFQLGHWYNPYTQNVIKGDYPVIGQHTFLNITASSVQLVDTRQTPIGTTPFESTTRPNREEFFGSPNQLAYNQFVILRTELMHGDAAFKPLDWMVVLTPIFNGNTLNLDELAVVNPDVRKGVQRDRTFFALEEYFVETKIADTSPYYDFVSARAGSQFFVSDFRGFLFADTNRALRIFGTREANRDQFNIAIFRQAEKDTNSGLNTFDDRRQNVFIANYYRQDFIWPGYTVEASFHYNHDPDSFHFDTNHFLVRPDPVGDFKPHTIDVGYLGLAGNGHIDRYNITHQFYWAFGHDTHNPLANQPVDVSAFFAAVELSYDRDWARFRTSFLYSEGDHNINNSHATGFDSILDNPNFAGGQFSFFQRQSIRLFGANVVNGSSLIPDLRSSKIQGQSNFVNPGLLLFNLGADFDITPKLKMINNINFLWFESTQVLQQFTFDGGIDTHIGTDISAGFEYRPLLSNNVIMTFGVSTLVPGSGFKALYNQARDNLDPLVAAFTQLNLNF